jgi:hypothetical protein
LEEGQAVPIPRQHSNNNNHNSCHNKDKNHLINILLLVPLNYLNSHCRHHRHRMLLVGPMLSTQERTMSQRSIRIHHNGMSQ